MAYWQVQRRSGGTDAMTISACSPQPVHVTLPQCGHCAGLHMPTPLSRWAESTRWMAAGSAVWWDLGMLQLGTLTITSAVDRSDLLAAPTAAALATWAERDQVGVAEIDPDLADTAAFCAAYDVPLAASANCVVLAGKREGEVRMAACVVLATTRADVNNVARRWLDVRKISFASMDDAVALTGMEYGGITPVGLPTEWPILIDPRVIDDAAIVIGSGIRGSKLVLPGAALRDYPGVEVIEGLASPLTPSS